MKSLNTRHSHKTKQRTWLFAAILTVILFSIGFYLFSYNPLSRVVHALALPLWSSQNAAANFLADTRSLLEEKRKLVEENNLLRQELDAFQEAALRINYLTVENRELKFLLGGSQPDNAQIATVLARPNMSPYDTLVINRGRNDGIVVGDRVLAVGEFIIGEIREVYDATSVVVLYSTYGEQVSVIIGESNLLVEAFGRGGGNLLVQLPRDIEIKEGDVIRTPDFGGGVFGIVDHISTSPTDAFQFILFKSPVNMTELGRVYVISESR